MSAARIYRTATRKTPPEFVTDLEALATARGFVIHNRESMAMAATFDRHGLALEGDSDLHLIQLCKPHKAVQSLSDNPERGVLMPKFIVAYRQHDTTQVRFLSLSAELVRQLVDDPLFPTSLEASYQEIHALIDAAC